METARVKDSRSREEYPVTQEAVETAQKQKAGGSSSDTEKETLDVDKILDEIDELLGEDSEEFVKNFRQKNGQ